MGWQMFRRTKEEILDYGKFIKIDTFLLHRKIEHGDVETIIRNEKVWLKWNSFYFNRQMGMSIIRQGSIRESDTIFIGYFDGGSKWFKAPPKELVEIINSALDYWDLEIG